MANASPSTTMSWKPISSTIVTDCRHALSSAVIGSEMFSHGKYNPETDGSPFPPLFDTPGKVN
ncbi:hypothetical protein ES288_A05G352800v1 [Gossypium darwinii]|uniref:Uncharacterized protein n=1 Tax=Gossypium darwinii TaxID=34276 RepID=A0A5D2GPS7_GOSDA|nr:hypothetical protein ES288_A05G352800v1 [Gossypium darwinii]